VAVERKHGGSCGCSSSLVYIFFSLSLPFLSSASAKCPPSFYNISLRSFPAPSPFFSSSSILSCFPFFLPLVSVVSVCFSSLLSLSKTYCFSLLVSPFSLKNCRSLSQFLLPFSFKKILPALSFLSSFFSFSSLPLYL